MQLKVLMCMCVCVMDDDWRSNTWVSTHTHPNPLLNTKALISLITVIYSDWGVSFRSRRTEKI